MADFYLELYRGDLPREFKELPGADHYDPREEKNFWAVLTSTPVAGSEAAAYIAPAAPPPGSPSSATTHGTDTLPAGTQEFSPTELCIWRPKTPPYRFTLLTPTGETIVLEPPLASTSEAAWHCLPVSMTNAIGIWIVTVDPLDGISGLPVSLDGRNAHLNPAKLNFTADTFYQQPLLRVVGAGTSGQCAEISNITVDGCAPGTVQLTADIDLPNEIEEITWDFGDGSPPVSGGPELVNTSHSYSEAGPFQVSVVVVRHPGCSPMARIETATVEACPEEPPEPVCPSLQSLEIVSDHQCAPGTVRFRAVATNPQLVEEWAWEFGDGTSGIVGGAEQEHTFPEIPGDQDEFIVTLTILRPSGCSPRTDSETIQVLRCRPLCADARAITVAGCAPGEVTLSVTGENLDAAEAFDWDFGDGETASTQEPTVTHTYADAAARTVSAVIVRDQGCVPRTQVRTASVEVCEPDDDEGNGNDDNDVSFEIPWCLILFLSMLFFVFVTLVAFPVAVCFAFVPEPTTLTKWIAIVAAIIAFVAFVIGTVLFIWWMIACVRRHCLLLLLLIDILIVLDVVVPLIGLVLAALGHLPCGLSLIVDFLYVSVLLAAAIAVGRYVGCLRRPPWWPRFAAARRIRQ